MRCWHIFLLWFFISNRDEFLFLDESVDVNIRKVCFLLVIKNYLIKATNFQKSSFLFITSQTVLDGTLNPFINDIPFSSHDQNHFNISAICDFSFPFLSHEEGTSLSSWASASSSTQLCQPSGIWSTSATWPGARTRHLTRLRCLLRWNISDTIYLTPLQVHVLSWTPHYHPDTNP